MIHIDIVRLPLFALHVEPELASGLLCVGNVARVAWDVWHSSPCC